MPGETPHDRRERLREVMSRGRIPSETLKQIEGDKLKEKSERTEEQFIEGDKDVLIPVRKFLADDSISRARQRLEGQE